jgi:hypothetical protein
MELSASLKYVMMRAQAEAYAAKYKGNPTVIEFVFLGLLKLAEVQADAFAPGSRHMKELNADIEAVKQKFALAGIDTGRTRSLLRALLLSGATPSGDDVISERLTVAVGLAQARGMSDLWAQDLLSSILEKPTDTILQICPLKQAKRMREETRPAILRKRRKR